MPKGKNNKYTDLEGRTYNSLAKLCRENNINYNKCQRLHKKGMALKDAIKECMGNTSACTDKGSTPQVKKEDKVPDHFIPESDRPGREYIRYFKWSYDYWRKRTDYDKGMDAVEDYKEAQHALDVIDKLEPFWLECIDAYVCNDIAKLAHIPPHILTEIRTLEANPTETYKDIYEIFSKEYHLGKYSEEHKGRKSDNISISEEIRKLAKHYSSKSIPLAESGSLVETLRDFLEKEYESWNYSEEMMAADVWAATRKSRYANLKRCSELLEQLKDPKVSIFEMYLAEKYDEISKKYGENMLNDMKQLFVEPEGIFINLIALKTAFAAKGKLQNSESC